MRRERQGSGSKGFQSPWIWLSAKTTAACFPAGGCSPSKALTQHMPFLQSQHQQAWGGPPGSSGPAAHLPPIFPSRWDTSLTAASSVPWTPTGTVALSPPWAAPSGVWPLTGRSFSSHPASVSPRVARGRSLWFWRWFHAGGGPPPPPHNHSSRHWTE